MGILSKNSEILFFCTTNKIVIICVLTIVVYWYWLIDLRFMVVWRFIRFVFWLIVKIPANDIPLNVRWTNIDIVFCNANLFYGICMTIQNSKAFIHYCIIYVYWWFFICYHIMTPMRIFNTFLFVVYINKIIYKLS